MQAAPGEKMEWAGAWKIANVTATFVGAVGLLRLKKSEENALHVGFTNSLPQAVVAPGGERGQGWGRGARREPGTTFVLCSCVIP